MLLKLTGTWQSDDSSLWAVWTFLDRFYSHSHKSVSSRTAVFTPVMQD